MIGITGTMISLIPNMGTRVLGNSWITNSYSFLPLFLSIIIFFGAVFLTICFFLIFGLILKERKSESGVTIISLKKKALLTWYAGDFQRIILLLCLVPMWIGLTLFFILLIPVIPNKYSWLFASVPWLSGILFVLFAYAGWSIGKKLVGKIPGTEKSPRLSMAVFTLAGIVFYLLILSAALHGYTTAHTGYGDITIGTDQQYFSPHISTAKGLRLDIMNITGSDLDESRSTWSADYGYFINVVPTTSEVIILGNP
ncbi:MAG: hypothetical protein Q8R70_03470, partial [Methanoregula sp.]|nr:hypothetical protein [Methanoregula sp.]